MAQQVKIASRWKAFMPTGQCLPESTSTCARAANGKPGWLDFNLAGSLQLAAKPDRA